MKNNLKLNLISLAMIAATTPAIAEEEETITVFGEKTQHSQVTTATKISTPTKLVPQTIESLPVEEITAFGNSTLSEALVGIPGINASGDTRFDGVKIRGFKASNDFYLDGFRDDMQYTRDLGNIETVEILKGPAAVLYGRGSSGGIINRVTKKPEAGLGSKLTTRIGSNDFYRVDADLNGEVNEDVQVRLNIAYEDAGSFRKGVDSKRNMLAPSISWNINDDVTWLVQYERHESERVPDRGIPSVNGSPADVPIDTVYSNTDRDYINDIAQSARSRLTWNINSALQLRHLFSYTNLNSEFDNTYVSRADENGDLTRSRWQQDLKANNFSNNFELENQFNTGFAEHNLLIGWEQSWQERIPKLYRNSGAIPSGNAYQPNTLPSYNGPMKLQFDSEHKVESYGLYLQDQVTIGNWIGLAGIRYDDFEIKTHKNTDNSEETVSNGSWSPRLGLVWNPVNEHAAYLSYSKTFLPVGGGLIGISPGKESNQLDPEHTRLYETGIKSDWFDGSLATTLSVYRLEMYNRRTRDPLDPSKIILTGLQRTDGIELSFNGFITEEITVRGGIAYQDAELVKAEDNIQGNRPTNTSSLNGQFFVGYKEESGLFGETGFIAVGDRFADSKNTVSLPGYARFDARVGYEWNNWIAQLSVENLLDKEYYVSATGAGQIMPGSPREFNLTTSYKF
ncbi:TonB-dependent receptor [Vibrio hepatarius]|uniref:TonB-dependent receptor n=1 Tax=Vibrio hepatarius TaxID=171383 RepID=UPI001C09663F|nr:TonB-dependent siderophore receptor [Vibrio hepatarius]